MPPVAQLALEAHPARMADRRRRRGRGDPLRLPVPAHGLRAELLDAGERPGPLPDGQDDQHPQRARDQLRAAEQRHGAGGPVQSDRRSARGARRRRPARQHTSPASTCSKNRTSAKATSSSRSPTSVRCRASSPKRSTAFRGSPARRSSSCSRAREPGLRRKPERVLGRGAAVGDQRRSTPPRCEGIAQLVASSVPGLQLSKVTITDASGQLLWPQAAAAPAARGTSVQEAEQRYDQSMAASLDAMLAQTLGPGKAQVLVYANMNVNQTTQGIARIRQDRHARCSRARTLETLTGSGAGAAARRAPRTSTTAHGRGRRKSNYKHETTTSSLGVEQDRHPLDDRPRHGGKPARVGAARPLGARRRRCRRSREAITNAAGIQTKRGDTISIGQVAFAKSARHRRPRREPARRRQVRAAGHRRDRVPLLHHPLAAPAREASRSRSRSGCASSTRRCGCPSSNARRLHPAAEDGRRAQRATATAARNGAGGLRRPAPPAGRAARRTATPTGSPQQLRTWMQEG